MPEPVTKIKPRNSASRPSFYRHVDRLVKRAFDLCAALWGLVLLSPFLLLIAVLIKRENPGPVFYRGRRVGRNGKDFHILKFRSMYEGPESHAGPRITAQDDLRVTPLGRWLRDNKINELPQLWNVLVGEMSLVGPRPEDPHIAENWPVNLRNEILSMRPGVTSPASVIYRDEEKLLKVASVMDDYLKAVLPDKLRLDQLYVRHHSFLSDLDVIFWTLIALLPGLRKDSIPTESLYNGLLYRFTRRYFSWFVIDNLVAFAAVSLAGLLWRMSGPIDLGIGMALGVAAGMALVFSLVNSVLGLGRIWWRHAEAAHTFDLAFSSGISTFLVTALAWLWPDGHHLPLGMLPVAGLLAFLGFVAVRYRERLLTGLATRWLQHRETGEGLGERLLIVGAGECGMLAAWLLRKSKLASAFSVVGMVDDNPVKQGMTIDGHQVLGITGRIPAIVQEKDVGVILFAIEKIQPAEHARILKLCRQTQARVVVIPDLLAMFRERLSATLKETI